MATLDIETLNHIAETAQLSDSSFGGESFDIASELDCVLDSWGIEAIRHVLPFVVAARQGRGQS